MRVQIDRVIVDDGTRQVRRGDTLVHLSPKAFDLLVALIRERPRAISKADLQTRLWPKTFVSDASLAMLVSEVRAALGETARAPKLVRTVHRHGYAFQGEAIELPESPVADDGPMTFWIVSASRQFPLTAGENLVGRDPKSRVWLDAPGVSRWHARISVDADRVTIEDLGSKNGTRVRGALVKALTALEDGDALRFGPIDAVFRKWAADPTRSDVGPS